MRIAATILLLLACVAITLGRSKIRKARTLEPKSALCFRKRLLGWTLVLAGVVLMIMGVVAW